MEKRKRPHARRKARASTGDIVAPSQPRKRIRPEWQKYYSRLMELRDSMLARQADLARDAIQEQPGFSTHIADAATDNYDRDLALGLLSSEQDAVYQIEQALDRIRNGSYGKCELTGRPIERGRLEAIPWTRFSAAAERQLEQQGVRKRARLGARETVAGGGQPDAHRGAAEPEEDREAA